jgi:hypothetical protein
MQTVEAQYIFTWDEYRQFYRFPNLSFGRKAGFILYVLCSMFLGFLGIIHMIYYDKLGAVLFLFFSFVFAFSLWLPILRAKRNFGKLSFKDECIVWKFDEEQVQITSPQAETRCAWSLFGKAIQCRDGYFLISEGRIGRWLPRKAFASPEDFETFEKLVKEKVSVIKKV